jgi:hypothetical protein
VTHIGRLLVGAATAAIALFAFTQVAAGGRNVAIVDADDTAADNCEIVRVG